MTAVPRRGWRISAAVAALSALAACGSSASSSTAPSASPVGARASASPSSSATPSPTPTPSPSPTVDPGTLPQLDTRPTVDANFMLRLNHYWDLVRRGYAGPSSDFYFPRAAYLQLKTLSYAAADYDGRLYHDFKNDVIADHQLITSFGPAAKDAKVLGVDVPEASVHWIPPGVEYNSIGYWQVSYARVRYQVAGQQHSYAISSMISWRGQWYIVHLGPNWRPGEGGWVCTPDAPAGFPKAAGCLRG